MSVLLPTLAQIAHHRDDWERHGHGRGRGVVVILLAILFIAAVVWAIFATRRANAASKATEHPATPQSSRAATILDERFARGEIDVGEYQQRRDALRAD